MFINQKTSEDNWLLWIFQGKKEMSYILHTCEKPEDIFFYMNCFVWVYIIKSQQNKKGSSG